MATTNNGLVVSPSVLRWARETAGETIEAVARRFNTTSSAVANWESTGASLSFGRLHDLAEIYKRSVATLLLPFVPAEPLFPTDFRRAKRHSKVSKKTRLAIRKAHRLQGIASDLRKETGETVSLQLFRLRNTQDPAGSAQQFRHLLDISVETQCAWPNEREALKHWIEAVEKLGVSVFQMSMSKDEVRGISLQADGARLPAVVLNTADSIRGRSFSLFHEMGHLLLGESGLCNLKNIGRRSGNEYEAFCDEFAGNFLLPVQNIENDELFSRFFDDHDPKLLKRISARYKVSQEMVLVRLYRANRLPHAAFKKLLREAQERRRPTSNGFQMPYLKCLGEAGRPLVSLTFKAMDQGKLSVSEAVSYLGLSRKHFKRLQDSM